MLQTHIEPFFTTQEAIDQIRALFLTLGGALIGAAAIAFSFIMFAMQVNVERMPHGLFRKFSSDAKLLSAFVVVFCLAAYITSLSLITNTSRVSFAVVSSIWCSILIVLLFVLSYRRALSLISPTMQLKLVLTDTKYNFEKWHRAANRIVPIINENSSAPEHEKEIREKYDMDRVTYFQLHPNWTAQAKQAILYCINYSRRFAEYGDHEVSNIAVTGIVEIHAVYVKTKGRTFFSENYLVTNPLASDDFLTNSLEHLRQNIQIAISRRDEQFIEQNFHCLLQLTKVYMSIQYGDEHSAKSHGRLVAGYLANSVESVIPHDMADVLLEGVALMGSAAKISLLHDRSEYVAFLSGKIATVACVGTVNSKYQAVTQIAVKQLTFSLIKDCNTDMRYAIGKVRNEVSLIAQMCLKSSDTSLASVHSSNMGPYYSGASYDSLLSWLTHLVNAISESEKNDNEAKRIVGNIVTWADGLYRTEKQLLLLAIENRSQLTCDLINWIVHVTKVLFAISCANSCSEHDAEKLKKSAHWLISVLSWIPDDKDTISYVETYRIADSIFDIVVDTHHRDCDIETHEIRKLLVNWMHKAGKYQTGWASLEKAIHGLACLNLILDLPDETLLSEIDAYLETKDSPNTEIRASAARELHNEAGTYRSGYPHDEIEAAMMYVDQENLAMLLHSVADRLSPEGSML